MNYWKSKSEFDQGSYLQNRGSSGEKNWESLVLLGAQLTGRLQEEPHSFKKGPTLVDSGIQSRCLVCLGKRSCQVVHSRMKLMNALMVKRKPHGRQIVVAIMAMMD
ncbi:hypothetical protein PS1_044282 [Malus domestica]